MNNRLHFSENAQGLFLLAAGIVLFLHVTGIITRSLDMIILIGAIIMIGLGLIKLDAYNHVMGLLGRKKQ